MAPVERAGVSNLICKLFAFVKACHDFTQTRTPARGFTFLTNGTTHQVRAVDAAVAAAEEEDASDVPESLGTRQRAASPARHRQHGRRGSVSRTLRVPDPRPGSPRGFRGRGPRALNEAPDTPAIRRCGRSYRWSWSINRCKDRILRTIRHSGKLRHAPNSCPVSQTNDTHYKMQP